ncbi:hypothetical protein [Streptomyces jumonjinensis]|uniref:hypothetical protein n=1 Tax=Streptomyces jumonjinensis TaxID=1945 RepID=UPI0037A54EE1
MSPDERDTFDRLTAQLHGEPPVEIIDPTPYGGAPAGKTGLTPRGKAVLGLAGAAVVGATLVGYASYSADSDTRAQEITLQRERLELERMKEMNRVAADTRKAAAEDGRARQAVLNDCVKDGSEQIGKDGGPWNRAQVVSECRKLGDDAEWADTKAAADMASAAAASDLNGGGDDGGDGDGGAGGNALLWIVGGGAALAVIGAKKAKKA